MPEQSDPVADLEAFLLQRIPGAAVVKIRDYTPMIGGYNRLMSHFDADVDGEIRPLVARAKPPAGYPTVIETDPDKEWAVLKWLSDLPDRDVPMPKARYYDADGSELGTKTIIIDFVEGESMLKRTKSADRLIQLEYADALADLAAAIHEIGASDTPPALKKPTSWDSYIDGCINAWRAVESAHGESLPVFRYLAQWLDDNRPQAAPLTLIHGELQASNIMIDSSGGLQAVDWEMARIGDPREDCRRRLKTDPVSTGEF